MFPNLTVMWGSLHCLSLIVLVGPSLNYLRVLNYGDVIIYLKEMFYTRKCQLRRRNPGLVFYKYPFEYKIFAFFTFGSALSILGTYFFSSNCLTVRRAVSTQKRYCYKFASGTNFTKHWFTAILFIFSSKGLNLQGAECSRVDSEEK